MPTTVNHAQQRMLDAQAELSRLAVTEDLGDEDAARMLELRSQMPTLIDQASAALAAGDVGTEGDPEPTAESDRLELRSRVNVGEILDSVRRGVAPGGAAAELQQELRLAPNEVPTECLLGDLELRAVTTVTNDIEVETQPGLAENATMPSRRTVAASCFVSAFWSAFAGA